MKPTIRWNHERQVWICAIGAIKIPARRWYDAVTAALAFSNVLIGQQPQHDHAAEICLSSIKAVREMAHSGMAHG